jgi:hypothetical protein
MSMGVGVDAIMLARAGGMIIGMIIAMTIMAAMRPPIGRRRPDARRHPCRMGHGVEVEVTKE